MYKTRSAVPAEKRDDSMKKTYTAAKGADLREVKTAELCASLI